MEGKKKHSLSRSLQNLFHKKHTYSLKQGKSKKSNKLYESINESSHFQLDPVVSPQTDKARVWSVRNSYSKSPVDTFTLTRSKSKKKQAENVDKIEKNIGHKFDTLSLYKVSSLEDNNVSVENYIDGYNEPSLDTSNEENSNSEDMSDRSRLSSFGSSNCYSETSHSCCSRGNSCHGLHECHDGSSTNLRDGISTSYWDLQLPESPALQRVNSLCRRYSDSISTDLKHCVGSPEKRMSLAKRRLSDGPGHPCCASWQDKILQSIRNSNVQSTLYFEQGQDVTSPPDAHEFQLPRLSCRKPTGTSVKRSRSVNEHYHSDDSSRQLRTSLQRSRSADFRLRKAMQKSRGRKHKLSERQFAFSDIESSEESESTQEPKDSSESPVTSSTDASSAYSYNSSNEIPAEKEELCIRQTLEESTERKQILEQCMERKQTLEYSVKRSRPVEVNVEGNDFRNSASDINVAKHDKHDGKEKRIGVSTPNSHTSDMTNSPVETSHSDIKGNEQHFCEPPEKERILEEINVTECNDINECKNTNDINDEGDHMVRSDKEFDAAIKELEDVLKSQDTDDEDMEDFDERDIDEDRKSIWLMQFSDESDVGTDVDLGYSLTNYPNDDMQTGTRILNQISALVHDTDNMDIYDTNHGDTDVKARVSSCQEKIVQNEQCDEKGPLTATNLLNDKNILSMKTKKEENTKYDVPNCGRSKRNDSEVIMNDFSNTGETHTGLNTHFLEKMENITAFPAVYDANNVECVSPNLEENRKENAPVEKLVTSTDTNAENPITQNPKDSQSEYVSPNLDENNGQNTPIDKLIINRDTVEKPISRDTEDSPNKDVTKLTNVEHEDSTFLQPEKALNESYDKYEKEIKESNETLSHDEVQVAQLTDIPEDNEVKLLEDVVLEESEMETGMNSRLNFHSMSMEDLLFCSGVNMEEESVDDVDHVFEAITKEAAKLENQDKDMMVMFLVGGELKVLRRSGSNVASHGDLRQDLPSMTRKDTAQHNGNRDYIFTHAIQDVNRGRPKSAIIVTRSQSFNGMANQHLGMGGRKDLPPAIVLGESFRHHRGSGTMPAPRLQAGTRAATGFSFRKSPKVPKVPRPNRALLMFQSVKRGIREFIDATKDDIQQLQLRESDGGTSTAQGRHHETDKQIKSAERYLKRLEFHLAKLDELHEYYMLQQQLREGVRTMHKAYVTSPGNQRNTLSNVKYGYKECTQTMCNIEAQLESMMGTFNCKLKGMAGFARLCPGDVFEVTVRHGTQKWKTKGRIEKTGNQKWDIPEFNFKAVVGDIINIKGLEVRAFKSVLLGQKSCETKDLFSANPQLMTVSINVNGSLKLSIVITWNPLDGVDEQMAFVEPQMRAQGTPRRRPVSVIALNGQYDEPVNPDRRQSAPLTVQQTKDDNFILRTNAPSSSHTNNNNVTSYHGLDSPHVSARLSEHLPEAYRQTGPLYSQTAGHIQAGFHSSPALMENSDSSARVVLPSSTNQNSAFVNVNSFPQSLHFPSMTAQNFASPEAREDENSVLNIEDVLHNLSSSLEDYHGQYTELQKLEELVKMAQKLIRKQFRSSSRSSSISVSIESALEAFDFLDTEEGPEDPQSPTDKFVKRALATFDFLNKEDLTDEPKSPKVKDNTKASFDDMLCSPESTAKTGDSGIESLAQRLSEDTQLGSSLGSSPVPPSTGNEEVDQCLMYHFTYCERLMENLGAFGPLKCREIYALDKLQKQCGIIDSLLKLARTGPQVDLHSVMAGICDDKGLREFWVKCTDQNSLFIHPDRLLATLEQKYASVIAEKYMIDHVKVCEHVMTRVMDIPDYQGEKGRSWFVLTLHQFMLYFMEEGGLKHVEDIAKEMKLVERLLTGNPDIVIKAILTLRDTLPSSPCLKVIGMLLATRDKEVEQCTISYLNLIQKRKESRDKALITFVEGLEDRTPEIRSGACAALAILEASESIDQLVYLWQSDTSAIVQKSAKEAMLSLGDEGRKAFEDAQLSKHGFQGVQVHK